MHLAGDQKSNLWLDAGKRMLLGDWAQCPACNFPANGTALARLLAVQSVCPMCNASLTTADIVRVQDPLLLLRKSSYIAPPKNAASK
jgi:WD repeat-containing protein 19